MPMSDSEYIKKAVKMADGWFYNDLNRSSISDSVDYIRTPHLGQFFANRVPQEVKDALAAQLVRQVDALEDKMFVMTCDNYSTVKRVHTRLSFVEGKDRTMDTVKAIVDSKVLEAE